MLFCSGRGYYRGNIRILWKYPCSIDILRISRKYQRSVDIIHISWIRPHSVDIINFFKYIHVMWILSAHFLYIRI